MKENKIMKTDKITGIVILANNKIVPLDVHSSLLVFDVYQWAEHLKDKFKNEEQASRDNGNTDMARMFNSLFHEVTDWIETKKCPQSIHPLMLRQIITPYKVTKTLLKSYVDFVLMELGIQYHVSYVQEDNVDFILDVPQGILYGTNRIQVALRNSDPSIQTVHLSGSEMRSEVHSVLNAKHTDQYKRKHAAKVSNLAHATLSK